MNKKFWAWGKGEDETALHIEGEISEEQWWGDETTPKDFRDQLARRAGKDVTVYINSYGGEVFAAAAIYDMLKEHDGNVTVKITGKAMSAASVIAMAGHKVLMSPAATLMIHRPWIIALGDEDEMGKARDVLITIKDTIVNAYQLKTGLPRDEIIKMVDDETYMDARAALAKGFIDEIMFVDEAAEQGCFNFSRQAVYACLRVHGLPQVEEQDFEAEALRIELELLAI